MRHHKRSLWKTTIAITSMFFLLIFLVGVPVSVANAQEKVSALATPSMVTVQVTPPVDETVTALNKEQLVQQVADQQRTWNNWLWSNAATILSSFLSTLVIVVGALFGLWRWRRDQHAEQEKRAEERFQAAVAGLGDDKEGARIGAAILLRTFLRPGYEQFYTQVFDLAVAHLRFLKASNQPEDLRNPLSLTPLSQALIFVFKEAFPLARDERKRKFFSFDPRSLDASQIWLDNAYLAHADLNHIWIESAFFRKANLGEANLVKATMRNAHLSNAHLGHARLNGANLRRADLRGVNFDSADLSDADLYNADLSKTNIETALSLKNTNLRGAKGLTTEQLEFCKVHGAIIDENPGVEIPHNTAPPSSV